MIFEVKYSVLVICLKFISISSGKKEVLVKRLKTYYKENNLKLENLNPEVKCKFDYICVIDFEATCSECQIRSYPHEIIEFPIVLINMKTLTIVR